MKIDDAIRIYERHVNPLDPPDDEREEAVCDEPEPAHAIHEESEVAASLVDLTDAISALPDSMLMLRQSLRLLVLGYAGKDRPQGDWTMGVQLWVYGDSAALSDSARLRWRQAREATHE